MTQISNGLCHRRSVVTALLVSISILLLHTGCAPGPSYDQPGLDELVDERRNLQDRWKKLTDRREEGSEGADASGSTPETSEESSKPDETKELHLSLEEAVRLALGENQQIRIDRVNPGIARAEVREALGSFDPELYAEVEQTDTRRPTGTTLSGARELTSEEQTGRMGFRGTFPIGLEYDLFYELVRNESNSRFRTLNPQYEGSLGVSVRQPLLRGFGPEVQLARYRARLDRLTKQQFQLLSSMNQQIFSVHRAYWSLVRAEEERRIAKETLKLARETVQVNRARYQADQIPEVDLLQARTSLAERREQLEVRKNDVREARDQLLQLISPPGTIPADWEPEVTTETEPDASAITLRKEGKLIELATNTRMDLKAIEKEMDAVDELLKRAENQVKPDLDLELSFRRNSLNDDPDGTFEQIRDENFRTWSAGLLFSYPLWNRSRTGKERKMKLKRRKLSLRRRKLETTIAREVRSGIRSVRSAKNRMEIARKSKNLAEKQLEAASTRQEAGLTTTFQVLRLQDDLRRARGRLLKARVDYEKAFSELRKAMGMLPSQHL